MCQTTRCYATYEQREDAFRQSVFSLIPRNYLGPGLFWSDFQSIVESLPTRLPDIQTIACITGNPRDCLALSTPWQELSAAILRSRRQEPHFSETPESVAGAFDLTGQLMQPVRTLSGGETVKLALAKTWVAASCCQKLAAASPCNWLSRSNRIFFDRVLDRFNRQGKDVMIFTLAGEDSIEPLYFSISADSWIDFQMQFQGVRIPLGDPLSLDDSNRVHARMDDGTFPLSSPCLIEGDNGQGKSLVAKVLSGSIPSRGWAAIQSGRPVTTARLLFQDMTVQTLFRSFDQIVSSTGTGNKQGITAIYQEIMQAVSEHFSMTEPAGRIDPNRLPTGWCSLLELKAALVAARLLYQPAAMILDEPDWGLSRNASAAFVGGVISAAHRRSVPVVLISHKPWWDWISRSRLKTTRSPITRNGPGEREFRIGLERVDTCLAMRPV